MDTPGPYASYIEGWKRRFRERDAARRERAARARDAAEACARILAEKHGARRVWLYGSTLRPEIFDERSDIDLAVEGVADTIQARLDCEDAARGFEFSILPIESAFETFKQVILEEGVLLHDAPA